MLAGDRHTQHRHGGFGGQHARQMRRPARTGDDGLQATAGGGFGIGKHVVGHAMRRDDACLVRDAELLQDRDCVLHGVPVGVGAHQNTHF